MEVNNIIEGSSIDDALLQLGAMKKSGEIKVTWDDLTDVLNDVFSCRYTESHYRKRYKALKANGKTAENSIDESLVSRLHDMDVGKTITLAKSRDKRKFVYKEAVDKSFFEAMADSIERMPYAIERNEYTYSRKSTAIYALLSDIHYGMNFKTFNKEYSPQIAEQMVMQYAREIVAAGVMHETETCYVSMLGDLISGGNHVSIKIENAENIVDQIMHVSELIAQFLGVLARNFKHVYVNSVSGNHSRVEPDYSKAVRKERLDDIVAWYCKARLSEYPNIEFCDNTIDTSLCIFDIFGKKYVGVHGDFDPNDRTSVYALSQFIDSKIDYFVQAHLHTPEVRLENVGYIRNGSVIPSGDDYTTRKRLFGSSTQMVMVCSADGVEDIIPIRLGGDSHGDD